MDPNAVVLALGLCSFPVYVAYREAVSGGNYALAWAAAEASILVLLIISSLVTQGNVPWGPYGYAALLCLSYWRLFKLKNANETSNPLPVIAWVLGISLVVGIVFFLISFNRYTFIRGNDEYQVQVYDRFTGKRHY